MLTLPDGVRLDTTHASGLDRVLIDRPACRAALFLYGAHLVEWAPRGHAEVLFVSSRAVFQRGKPIRGGVPICLPWFGASPAGQHGFARTQSWSLAAAELVGEGARVRLDLSADGSHPGFPHAFVARYTVTFGATLDCALELTNASGAPFAYEDALHTYFALADARAARVSGLEGLPYLDHAVGDSPKTSEPEPFALRGETDRLYLGTRAPVAIEDPVGRRVVLVEKEGSSSTVVWNPGAAKSASFADLGPDDHERFVCVEAVNARSDRVTVEPGAAHATRMRVSVRVQR